MTRPAFSGRLKVVLVKRADMVYNFNSNKVS